MADFGSDISTFPDLDPNFIPISGTRAAAQRILRRLETPRGTLEEDPDYGFDLRGLLLDEVTRQQLNVYRQQIASECTKDEEVLFANVLLQSSANGDLTVTIQAEAADGPFEMTIKANALTLELLKVTA